MGKKLHYDSSDQDILSLVLILWTSSVGQVWIAAC